MVLVAECPDVRSGPQATHQGQACIPESNRASRTPLEDFFEDFLTKEVEGLMNCKLEISTAQSVIIALVRDATLNLGVGRSIAPS